MRKDVECTFGILKGRWHILKAGIRLHGVDAADNVWMTCCALHNWLLEIDELSLPWDGEFGLHDIEDGSMNVPFALSRLQNGEARRQYDSSGMGPGLIDCDANHETDDDGMILQDDAEDLDETEEGPAENLLNPAKKVSMNDFTILKVIGRGSFGKVYLVRHNET